MVERQRKHIPFEEFADNLASIIDKVVLDEQPVFVESQSGTLIEVKVAIPKSLPQRGFSKEEDEAFLSAAGSWSDVDIDEFLQEIHESRSSSRPPVDV